MLTLIDADIVAYRCAAVTKDEHESVAIFQTEELVKRILQETEATSYISYLTGPNNFRYKVNPEYKANRKDVEKPKHLGICRDFIMNYYNGVMCDGYEADDAMGIKQCNSEEDTVIASIDKDMLMIPGYHYNFVKKEFSQVSELEGIKQLYRQMIIGDTTDNIFGIKGVGKVGAAKLIDHLTDESQMYLEVWQLYNDDKRFFMNADCLWIQRNKDEKYTDRKEPKWLATILQETNLSVNQTIKTTTMAGTEYLTKDTPALV